MQEVETNSQIAQVLNRIVELLEAEHANPFRVCAYRDGAQTIRNADQPVAEFVHNKQLDHLDGLRNIGSGISAVVRGREIENQAYYNASAKH